MSDSDMLRAAEAEVVRLEAEVAATPAYKKLQLAKQVVAMYRADKPNLVIKAKPKVAPIPLAQFLQEGAEFAKEFIEKTGVLTKAARIETAAVKHLTALGRRATSGELLPVMKAEGIEITGQEPGKALSAYLSNSKLLNNNRELGGYGLVEWGNARGPDLLMKTGAD